MTDQETIRALREQIARIEEEKETYRRAIQALLAEKYPFDAARLEEEIREVKTNGIPLEKVIEEIKARYRAA